MNGGDDQINGTPACDDDSDCDDGLFCTGNERCIDGQCQEGTPPCPPFEDCELCDEDFDECALPCTTDDQCFTGIPEDEQFCDGCVCLSVEKNTLTAGS